MLEREMIAEVETDKLSENFSVRIPEILKISIDKMSPSAKKRMKQAVLILLAEHVHQASFNPLTYLRSDD